MKEVFEPMASIGIPASVTMEEFNKENELETLIYLDKDELYVKAEGFAIYNKTAIASQEEVDNFIKSLKPSIVGEPSVLKYDVDGNLIVDQSKIHPFLLGCVLDHYEAPDNVLLASPQIIAEVSSQYSKEQIPKQLAIRYNKAFPKYTWRVLVDPENHYITRDVSVTLSYDNVDLDETSDISYLVVGVKKSNATTK
ncbi:uncharacterized protein BDFB_006553 [Asbolus verrucosus]|uniref:Uncharacterized protein n=1 Tax=Asbolus verrucosus TaxID=1661398 RepID=A0A482W0H6_ASBVE|nr:uncharacterized protein BDFB_006553 [Asbolus verrucosus]